jgi:predicted RNA-binding Zn ribbon-like protein
MSSFLPEFRSTARGWCDMGTIGEETLNLEELETLLSEVENLRTRVKACLALSEEATDRDTRHMLAYDAMERHSIMVGELSREGEA